jgi:hypothetical protein
MIRPGIPSSRRENAAFAKILTMALTMALAKVHKKTHKTRKEPKGKEKGANMLEHLFSPIEIGTMKLKNRIVLPPMTVGYGVPEGTVMDRHRDYYEARARGGVGFIIAEGTAVNADRKYGLVPLGLYDDAHIESWSVLAKAVHSHGAKLATQLMDPGPESMMFLTGIQPVGPSPVVGHGLFRTVPRELSVGEIEGAIEDYAAAFGRARLALSRAFSGPLSGFVSPGIFAGLVAHPQTSPEPPV